MSFGLYVSSKFLVYCIISSRGKAKLEIGGGYGDIVIDSMEGGDFFSNEGHSIAE